ncbi:hypothetical protein AB5J49_00145 [Streptomyces sp. R28]|uniref:Uncharacterized protein n=1 Tax=Streptomyces sp. R28 TaxID=3238628 RepID=A0AB39PQ31_9ACTN
MVQSPGQLSIGSSRRLQLLCPFVDFALLGGNLLLKESDATLELVDVDGSTEAGFGPDGIAELGGQAALQLPDPCREALVTFQRVREVGLQRSSADRRDPPLLSGGVGGGVDAFEQVTMAIKEGPIDSGGSGETGDGDVPAALGGGVDGLTFAFGLGV